MSGTTRGQGASPCSSCGACCAFLLVSLQWYETDDVETGGVPLRMTQDIDAFRKVMRGTDSEEPRCVALEGDIGREVRCTIYERRPGVCRAFAPSWSNGARNDGCDRARALWGLRALAPSDWDAGDESGSSR